MSRPRTRATRTRRRSSREREYGGPLRRAPFPHHRAMKNRILIAAAVVLIIATGALLGGVFRESPSPPSPEIAQAEQQVQDFHAGFQLNASTPPFRPPLQPQ